MTTVEMVLAEHTPRPGDDPLYIPWWSKGEYARAHGTKWAMPDGTQIVGGQVVVRGSGAFPSASKVGPLSKPQPQVQKRSETPTRASPTPSRGKRPLDRVDELLQEHRTLDARTVLCVQHGINPAILRDAPNPGVASMRLANALRKVLQ
jgi:hypothetical protein